MMNATFGPSVPTVVRFVFSKWKKARRMGAGNRLGDGVPHALRPSAGTEKQFANYI